MCLAIPAKITGINGTDAEIDIEGVRRQVSIYLTPEARVGDYVLLHAGFAIKVLDMQEAQETLELARRINAVGQ
jgi:hydrogenase expression/formation protein HypC